MIFVFLDDQEKVIATVQAETYLQAMSLTGYKYAGYEFRIEANDE